jgi:NitT/TauT family transport system substrate-binding protein
MRNASIRTARLLAAIFVALAALPAVAADDVSFAFDWIYNGTHAGYFVARDKGYYKDADLNVTLSRGSGSGDTVKRVGTGGVNFGIADTSVVVAARANEDIPVRIVAMAYGKSPLGVIYLKESGIKSPKDLVGKTIGRTASGSSVTMWPAFLAANGIDRAQVKETVADANALLPLLLSRRVDAVLGQTVNIGRFKALGEKQGVTAVGMNFADFGLVAYGNAIIAHPKTLQESPDLVRRFVEASMKGLAYAVDHPEEALAILKKAVPEVDTEAARDELVAMKPIVLTDEVKKHGVGYASEQNMQATIDSVEGALKLKRKVSVGDVFDPRFLPKQPIFAAR